MSIITRGHPTTVGLALAVLLALPTAPALARFDDGDDPLADGYVSGDFGRLRFVENGVEIVRAETEAGPSGGDVGINAPILPGDTVSTAGSERAEIQLAGGSLIRIDRATEVSFLSLPDPYAEFVDNTVLQLAAGTLRIAADATGDEEFRVDTPASSIYALDDADLRIEVGRSGRTRVWSRRGVVEVVGDGASVLVRAGTQTEVHPGLAPDQPWAFNTFSTDGFDLWVAQREAVYRDASVYEGEAAVVYESLPAEVRPYYAELSSQGRWVLAGDHGYVWYPSSRPLGWRPYHYGYWQYGPRGYFWVAHEPWGWAPYHYGRWAYLDSYGWCWSPGRVFSGAWVSWSWGSLHVGWSPLDFWGRPAYVRHVYHRYYDPYAWTFVGYRHLHRHDYHHYAVPLEKLRDELPRHVIARRPAAVAPRRLVESETARREAIAQVRAHGRSILPPGKARPDTPRFDARETIVAGDGQRSTAAGAARERYVRTGRVDAAIGATGRGPDAGRGGRRAATVPPPRYPSRARSSAAGEPTVTTVPGRTSRTAGRAAAAGERAAPTVRPMQRQGVDERAREIFRKVAAPRTTRERVDDTRREGGTTATRGRPATDAGSTDRRTAAGRTGGDRTPTKRESADRPARRREPAKPSGRSRPTRGGDDGGRGAATRRPTPSRSPAVTRTGSSRTSRPPVATRTRPTPTRSPAATSGSGTRRPSAAPSRRSAPSRSSTTRKAGPSRRSSPRATPKGRATPKERAAPKPARRPSRSRGGGN